jgi:hypothetical protein
MRNPFGRAALAAAATLAAPPVLVPGALEAQELVTPIAIGAPAEAADTGATPATRVALRAAIPGAVPEPPPLTPAQWLVRHDARRDGGYRVIVSIGERRLTAMRGDVVLLEAPVAVGSGVMLEYEGRSWRFETPIGRRTVLARVPDPVWIPPDWHYVERAHEHGFVPVRLERGKPAVLRDGTRLHIEGDSVVRRRPDRSVVEVIPAEEEVLYERTLYVPPIGVRNRRIPGELGRFKLELGDGYLIHGTPHRSSIGGAVTHGCIRLLDEDIERLYEMTPVGAPVYIY